MTRIRKAINSRSSGDQQNLQQSSGVLADGHVDPARIVAAPDSLTWLYLMLTWSFGRD
jgi:hypothetical protein